MKLRIDTQKRIVLPSQVMEYLKLKPGDYVEVLPNWEPDSVLLRGLKEGSTEVCDNSK